jgi:hypothetical protein
MNQRSKRKSDKSVDFLNKSFHFHYNDHFKLSIEVQLGSVIVQGASGLEGGLWVSSAYALQDEFEEVYYILYWLLYSFH